MLLSLVPASSPYLERLSTLNVPAADGTVRPRGEQHPAAAVHRHRGHRRRVAPELDKVHQM